MLEDNNIAFQSCPQLVNTINSSVCIIQRFAEYLKT